MDIIDILSMSSRITMGIMSDKSTVIKAQPMPGRPGSEPALALNPQVFGSASPPSSRP